MMTHFFTAFICTLMLASISVGAMDYRSVRIVVQNSTSDALVLEGFSAMQGTWQHRPTPNSVISRNSTKSFDMHSEQPGIGVEGFIRLVGTGGYVLIEWRQPWVGPFSRSIESSRHFNVIAKVDTENPSKIVMIVTLASQSTMDRIKTFLKIKTET